MSRRATFARRGVRAKLAVELLRDAGHELRHPERLVVLLVAIGGEVDATELAAATGLARPTIKRYADQLAERGWIDRHTFDRGVTVYRATYQIRDAAIAAVADTR